MGEERSELQPAYDTETMSNAWKKQNHAYPKLKADRPSGFTPTRDGKGVLIAGYNQPVVFVIEGKDLHTLRAMIDARLNPVKT